MTRKQTVLVSGDDAPWREGTDLSTGYLKWPFGSCQKFILHLLQDHKILFGKMCSFETERSFERVRAPYQEDFWRMADENIPCMELAFPVSATCIFTTGFLIRGTIHLPAVYSRTSRILLRMFRYRHGGDPKPVILAVH